MLALACVAVADNGVQMTSLQFLLFCVKLEPVVGYNVDVLALLCVPCLFLGRARYTAVLLGGLVIGQLLVSFGNSLRYVAELAHMYL